MALDLQPGDRARVKAAMYRPSRTPEDTTIVMNGQIMELTEEDLARSDAELIWEPVDDATLDALDNPDAVQEVDEEEVAIDTATPGAESMAAELRKMSPREAKLFLSNENWTVEGLQAAREAEEAGKNREPILKYIDGRIGQLDEVEGQQV
jgi:hypothetical protein